MVLSGGVGGSRFIAGLRGALPQARVTVVGNTGDDFEVHGLHVSPDLDTCAYALSGLGDWERGWGLRAETWGAAEQLRRLGAETWFQLGDHDLATHLWRTEQLRRGRPLSEVTSRMAERLQLDFSLLPMSDDRVETRVLTRDGRDLHIQEYLVREGCRPAIERVEYRGIERARPAPGVLRALAEADLLLIAPSNPVISIGPILALPGLRRELASVPQGVAVSPIVAGEAIKGPAVAMMESLGVEASAAGIARIYSDLVQHLVLDSRDAALAEEVSAAGVEPHLCDTMMLEQRSRERVAAAALRAAGCDPLAAGSEK